MPLDDYFGGLERARKIIDTNHIALQKAFLNGLEKVKDSEGLYDSQQFSKNRSEILDIVSADLSDGAKAHFKVSADVMDDPFKKHQLMTAYCGLSRVTLDRVMQKLLTTPGLSVVNLGDFIKASGKYTQQHYNTLAGTALSFLKPTDADAVLKYVDPQGTYNLDPAKDIFRDTQVLAELANQFKQYGTLIPRYVEARPQIFKDGSRANSGLTAVVGGRAGPASAVRP